MITLSKEGDFLMLRVEKRDNSLQDFDRGKIIAGILKSGATQEQAEEVAGIIDSWILTVVNDKNVVASNTIYDKVLELLKRVNLDASVTYQAFRK